MKLLFLAVAHNEDHRVRAAQLTHVHWQPASTRPAICRQVLPDMLQTGSKAMVEPLGASAGLACGVIDRIIASDSLIFFSACAICLSEIFDMPEQNST
jgi:hypothetical protein